MVWGTLQCFFKSPSSVGPALGQEEFGVLCTWMGVSFQRWAGVCR